MQGSALSNWKLKAFSSGDTRVKSGTIPASVTTDIVELMITARKQL